MGIYLTRPAPIFNAYMKKLRRQQAPGQTQLSEPARPVGTDCDRKIGFRFLPGGNRSAAGIELRRAVLRVVTTLQKPGEAGLLLGSYLAPPYVDVRSGRDRRSHSVRQSALVLGDLPWSSYFFRGRAVQLS